MVFRKVTIIIIIGAIVGVVLTSGHGEYVITSLCNTYNNKKIKSFFSLYSKSDK